MNARGAFGRLTAATLPYDKRYDERCTRCTWSCVRITQRPVYVFLEIGPLFTR